MSNKAVFEVPPHVNGGESLLVETSKDSYGAISQSIILNAYGNSCTLNLSGNILTPKVLRDLADEIEEKFPELE